MLLVKTYLDRSPIEGIGLFAAENIPRGTKIYQVDPILTLQLDLISTEIKPEYQGFLDKYAWISDGKYYLSVDNDRFMNHSLFPNTYELPDSTYALVNIKKGEEITCNYNLFHELGTKNFIK